MILSTNQTNIKRTSVWGASFVIISSLVGLAITGCGKGGSSSSDSPSTPGNFDSSTMKGTDIVASVNGDSITAAELFDGMAHYVPAGLPRFPNNPQLGQQTGPSILKNLIFNKIEIQFAKDKNVPVAQSDLDRSFADYQVQQQAGSTIPADTLLQQLGYTPDQFKREVLAPEVAEINILQTGVVLSDDTIQEMYKETSSQYTLTQAVHCHRIVCATESQADNVAKGVRSGHSMSEYLADNIARDGQGGNLSDDTDWGNWIRTDKPLKELGKAGPALAEAKIGDVVGPYQIDNAWWVFQVVDKRSQQLMPFDQVKDLVRINYIRRMAGVRGNEELQLLLLQKLRNSVVKIYIPAYQNLAVAMHDINLPNAPRSPASGHTKSQ